MAACLAAVLHRQRQADGAVLDRQRLARRDGRRIGPVVQKRPPRRGGVAHRALLIVPVGRRAALCRQLRAGPGRRRRDQGGQTLGAGGPILAERRRGLQQPFQPQHDQAGCRGRQIQRRRQQPGQGGQIVSRVLRLRHRRQVDGETGGDGQGRHFGVARVEAQDHPAVQRGLGRRQGLGRARRDLGAVGQGDQRRPLKARAQAGDRAFAVHGAQDVGVRRAAAAGQGGGAPQGRVARRIAAIAAWSLAAIHGVGDPGQGGGQGLGRLGAQPVGGPSPGMIAQLHGRARIAQIDHARRHRGARRRRGQAQLQGARQFGGEGVGGLPVCENALGAAGRGQGLREPVRRPVQPVAGDGLAQPHGVGPVQPGLDPGVGPAGGRQDCLHAGRALDGAGFHRDSFGAGGEAGLKAHGGVSPIGSVQPKASKPLFPIHLVSQTQVAHKISV